MNKYLTYEAFGAKGDGKTNDFPAIVACHDEANKLGLPVKANDDATYYIGGNALTAIIKTDVDFGKAKFIIDDTAVEDRRLNIFCLKSDHEAFTPEISPLKKGQKHTDNPYGEKIFVRVFNSKEKIFIRKGLNMNNGTATTDCFLLDKDGNVSPSIDWDYPEITDVYAIRTDDKPITICGGEFTTIANRA